MVYDHTHSALQCLDTNNDDTNVPPREYIKLKVNLDLFLLNRRQSNPVLAQ